MNFVKELLPYKIFSSIKKFVPRKKVHWGCNLSLQPINRDFGAFVGTPVDRYYIEKFLSNESLSIRGNVLEIAETLYTKKFASHNYKANALQLDKVTGKNDIKGNLVTGEGLLDEQFDCVILTQTLPFIFDFRSAINNLRKTLKPGGVILATLSGISQISRFDMDRWGDYWRFTGLSARKVFEETFALENIFVHEYGNALVATAFIQGIVVEQLKKDELDYYDRDYPVSICVKAIK